MKMTISRAEARALRELLEAARMGRLPRLDPEKKAALSVFESKVVKDPGKNENKQAFWAMHAKRAAGTLREAPCELCRGSEIEEVNGGHGTVVELPCSRCQEVVP